MLDAMFPNADQNDRESSLFKAVEKIPEIKSSGILQDTQTCSNISEHVKEIQKINHLEHI